MRSIVLSLWPLLAPLSASAADLIFSVRTWEGEYESRDIPGGVESTPVVSAICGIDTDGNGLRKIVQLGKTTDAPSISPDARWIYFQSNSTGRWQVCRCRPDGSGIACVAEAKRLGEKWKDAYGTSLSADGTKLLYTVHDGETGSVVLSNSDGSDPRLVAPDFGYLYMAALSPAKDRIVCSGPARGYRLILIPLPDGEPVVLTPDHPESFAPQFTPDGKTIIFIRRDGDVYRIDADGRNLRRLTEGNGYVEFKLSAKDRHGSTDAPHVSPDGERIAYIAIKDGVPNVCVMDIDGGGQRRITFRKTPCGRVRWSPDGRHLAFVSFEGKYPQLFVVPADGGKPRRLTNVEGAVYFVTWKPSEAAGTMPSDGRKRTEDQP